MKMDVIPFNILFLFCFEKNNYECRALSVLCAQTALVTRKLLDVPSENATHGEYIFLIICFAR